MHIATTGKGKGNAITAIIFETRVNARNMHARAATACNNVCATTKSQV
jgi:hypothetical protein